jgi:hypothetical protein
MFGMLEPPRSWVLRLSSLDSMKPVDIEEVARVKDIEEVERYYTS